MTARLMATDNYRAADGISQSDLKLFRSNPQLFNEYRIGKREKQPSTKSMEFGSAVDEFLLGSEKQEIFVIPTTVLTSNGQRRGKKWVEFEACHPGKLLTQEEYDEQQGYLDDIEANIRGHETANALVYGEGRVCHEQIAWECPYTGMLRKCELDIRHQNKILVDVKTAKDVTPDGFAQSVENFGYYIQAATYQEAIEELTGAPHVFYFVVIKNSPPYNVETYQLTGAWLEAGDDFNRTWMEKLKEAIAENSWRSSTHGDLCTIERPRWAAYRSMQEQQLSY